MTRAVLSPAIDSQWRLVSPRKPCPVCGGIERCSVHIEADFAFCAHEPSEWKLVNGAWLHRTGSRIDLAAMQPAQAVKQGPRVRL